MSGLRERKKSETRQRISNIASGMFMLRGYDNVTVAEVAEAAGVSKMTVFNYFPRKEELYFDRGDEAVELLTAAVAGRAPGEGLIAPLRRLELDLLDRQHPLGGLKDGVTRFWQVVLDSPALQAAAREGVDRLERQLTGIIAGAVSAEPDDPMPALVAGLVITAYRAIYLSTARRLLAGERAADIAADQIALTHRAFDVLEAGLPDYGARRP